MPTEEHSSWAYRVAAGKLRKQGLQPCVLCAEWIDYTLTYPHRDSFAAEHVVPVRDGGTWRDGLLPSHVKCQNEQGGRVRAGLEDERPMTSGVW